MGNSRADASRASLQGALFSESNKDQLNHLAHCLIVGVIRGCDLDQQALCWPTVDGKTRQKTPCSNQGPEAAVP